MSIVRLPSWRELFAEGAPWARLLRSRPEGLWLLRGEAEAVDGLVVGVVDGRRCTSSAALFREWAAALDLPESFGHDWHGFDAGVRELGVWVEAAGVAILVVEAERLLADEPHRLPGLLQSLEVAARGPLPLRVVFQVPRDADEARVAVFREFGAVETR